MTPKIALTLWLLWVSSLCLAAAGDAIHCPICGMQFKKGARTSFASTREGRPVHFCSYVCASRFHEKFKDAPLQAVDFDSGEAIDAKQAYFLIKSKNLLKELEFDMPPSIVAFSGEEAAKKVEARLKDGQVIKGIDAVRKAYE